MYPVDWEKTYEGICTAINALGSLATVGAFIYLFKKDKEKQTQIDKLTSISTELTQMKAIDNARINLSVKPEILKTGTSTRGNTGELTIDIENIGERAILTEFVLNSDDLILHNEHLPYTLQKGDTRKIFAKTLGEKSIANCAYRIDIYYNDKLDNIYKYTIAGLGSDSKHMGTVLHKPTTLR